MMDMTGKELVAKEFQPTSSLEVGEGVLWVDRREIYDDWSRIRNEWILIEEGRARSH